jgi:hypothetical protein
MAKFELKFFCNNSECGDFIKVEHYDNEVIITGKHGLSFFEIDLDKSTAIKFAKTLRTEINKITESEVKDAD